MAMASMNTKRPRERNSYLDYLQKASVSLPCITVGPATTKSKYANPVPAAKVMRWEGLDEKIMSDMNDCEFLKGEADASWAAVEHTIYNRKLDDTVGVGERLASGRFNKCAEYLNQLFKLWPDFSSGSSIGPWEYSSLGGKPDYSFITPFQTVQQKADCMELANQAGGEITHHEDSEIKYFTRFVVEIKKPSSFYPVRPKGGEDKSANETEINDLFNQVCLLDAKDNSVATEERVGRKEGEAIQRSIGQLYGYMVYWNLRYGALSTSNITWFFKRLGGEGEDPALYGKLAISRGYRYDEEGTEKKPSMALALVWLCWYTENKDDCFHASRPNTPIDEQLVYRSLPKLHKNIFDIQIYDLDDSLNFFENIRMGVSTQISPGNIIVRDVPFKGRTVFIKIRTEKNDGFEQLRNEVKVYKHLAKYKQKSLLLLEFIPEFYAYILAFGSFHCLILSDCGKRIETEKEYFDDPPVTEQEKQCSALADRLKTEFHVVHNDVFPRNFCEDTNGKIYIIDFGISEILEKESEEALRAEGSPVILEDKEILSTPSPIKAEQKEKNIKPQRQLQHHLINKSKAGRK